MGKPARNLAWLGKQHFGKVRLASFLLGSAPALWLAAEWLSDSLGINPLNRLLHFTGGWALTMLLVTLAVTRPGASRSWSRRSHTHATASAYPTGTG